MGNYLRIYKNLEEFKANTFNLPYPCVSVVDDDTIETDENMVEFEGLDKIKCKLEISSDVVNGKEEVQVAKFNNLSSVEAYSTNADNVVFVDVPKLIETEKEIQFTLYEGIYIPSYEDSVILANITYEMRWKASRPLKETDYLFVATYDAITGDIGEPIPLQYNDFIKMFVHHGNNEYGFTQEALNEITNSNDAAYIAYSLAFVDAEFVENKGVELPKSVTTTFPKKEYEGKYVATEITEFSNFEYSGRTVSLPSIDYAQPISSITTKNRWSVNRELYDTDYVVLVLYADSSTVNLMPIPSSGINDSVYITSYVNLEYGLSQPIISELRQAFPSASINLYFVDKDCYDSMLSNQPTTINTSVITYVIDGGLTSINVKTNELDENGVAELNLKVTNDFDNISFVDKQYLKSFDGSRYGLNNIKEISNNQFESSDKLEEFIIPNGVETVGNYAFNNCFSLSSVTIPESVTEIGAKAFRKCVFLSENFINQSSLDAEANNYWRAGVYDVIQEDGLCIRGTSVFGCRPNSSGVTIPDYITRIEENAFIGCTNLKRVDMPNSIKYIGKNAFRYCINVEKVVIPESVEEIASDAFTYCFFDLDVFENKSNINAKENNYWQAIICKDGCVSCCGVLLYIDGENVIIHDGVKEISAYAIRNRESIKSISIPNSVTSIGDNIFRGCTSLTLVTIPDSVTSIGKYAFSSCTSLTSVTIPRSITNIDDYVFSGCTSLTSVTIPSSVKTIGNNAFGGCICLNYIEIPDSVVHIDSKAFSNCSFQRDNFIYNRYEDAEFNSWWGAKIYDIVQDDGLYILGTTAITCKKNATNVTIPSNVTTIDSSTFNNCTSLSSITIPDSVTSIGDIAFSGCKSLQLVTIGSGVTSIGNYAFYNCTSLSSITIPNSVTSIGDETFSYCSSLTSVTIPDSVTNIGGRAFYNCTSLSSVTILDSITIIGKYAFWNCTSLTSVTIPDSVTSIGDGAFYNCTSLTSIVIPDSVTSIGEGAFKNCSSLTSIVIPYSVTSIGSRAFYNCGGLTSVTIGSGVTTIGENAFSGCYFQRDKFINNGNLTSDNNWGATIYDVIQDDGLCISGTTAVTCDKNATHVTILENVTTIGELAFYNCTSLSSITIPDSVTSIGRTPFSGCTSLSSITIPDSVTSIDDYVFSGCTSLTSITIPDSVTSIGVNAFYNCSSLTSITIPDNVTSIGGGAFEGCSGLTYITIPSSVTIIYSYAFSGCTNLTSITIPSSVTFIGSSAFTKCTSLTSVTIPNSVTNIEDNAFSGCYFQSDKFINNSNLTSDNNWGATLYEVIQDDGLCISGTTAVNCRPNATNVTIPSSVTIIGYGAFSGCTSLTSVVIPDSVTTIGSYAFIGCSSLTSVTIPNSVKYIGQHAFYKCISLTSVTIPNSVTRIEIWAFYFCTSLSSVTIPDSVTHIGAYAFYVCDSLTSVTIPDSVTYIGEGAFSGCYFQSDKFINNSSLTSDDNWSATLYDVIQEDGLCISGTIVANCRQNATSVTIPDSVTTIGSRAFYNCSGLTSVTIPDGVTSIGLSAFYCCSSLTSITIPDSVTSIGGVAFYGCTSLTSITIPDSVTSIGGSAFKGCTSLISIDIPNSVTSIGSNAFEGCNASIYNNVSSGAKYVGKVLYDWAAPNDNVSYGYVVTNGCVRLENECLSGATNYANVIIPSTVTSIGDKAFYGCTSLTSVTIPDSVTSIGSSAFTNCTRLELVTIPDSVTTMGNYAFSGCTQLDKIVIGGGVKTISDYAFSGCTQLDEVCIKEGVESIGSNAFYNCQLGSITLPSTIKSVDNTSFNTCNYLQEIICNATIAPTVNGSFSNLPTNGTLYVPPKSDYTSWESILPSGWVIKHLYEPTVCTNLVITANDVNGIQTNTQISYTATTNGINLTNNEVINDVILTGVTTSQPFDKNSSYTDTIEREITFEYLGVTASTTITQGVLVDAYYSIDLQNQWRMSSAVTNPDSNLYDGVYESFSNYNVNSSSATCVITIVGYINFKFYIRSYGESSYDYVNVYDVDSATTIKATTKGKSNSGTILSSYTLVKFTNLDGGEHTIKIVYLKDNSSHAGTDRGYLMIPYNQDV